MNGAAKFTAKELLTIETDHQVNAARFTPCGEFLIAGGFEGEIRRWKLGGEKAEALPALTGHKAWVQALAFDAETKTLYSGDSWGKLCAWKYDATEPRLLWEADSAHDGWLRQLALSPDGKTLASCGRDQTIRLWSAHDGQRVKELTGHKQDVYCVAFHPGGQWLVSGDDRGVVKVWDVPTGKASREFDASILYLLHRLQDVGGVRVMSFDADGKRLAVAGTKPKNGATVQGVPTALIFDFETGKLLHTLELGATKDCYVHEFVFHPADFVMAVTCGTPGTGELVFQRFKEKEPIFRYTKMTNCHNLSMHPDGKRFAVAATNRRSNGNGRPLDKNGEYPGNNSPIYLFEIEEAAGR